MWRAVVKTTEGGDEHEIVVEKDTNGQTTLSTKMLGNTMTIAEAAAQCVSYAIHGYFGHDDVEEIAKAINATNAINATK